MDRPSRAVDEALGRYLRGELAKGRTDFSKAGEPEYQQARTHTTTSSPAAVGQPLKQLRIELQRVPGQRQRVLEQLLQYADPIEAEEQISGGAAMPLRVWLDYLECVPKLWWEDPILWDERFSQRCLLEFMQLASTHGNIPLDKLQSSMDDLLRRDQVVWKRLLWQLTIFPGLKHQRSLCSRPIQPSEWDLELKLVSLAHLPPRIRRLRLVPPPRVGVKPPPLSRTEQPTRQRIVKPEHLLKCQEAQSNPEPSLVPVLRRQPSMKQKSLVEMLEDAALVPPPSGFGDDDDFWVISPEDAAVSWVPAGFEDEGQAPELGSFRVRKSDV